MQINHSKITEFFSMFGTILSLILVSILTKSCIYSNLPKTDKGISCVVLKQIIPKFQFTKNHIGTGEGNDTSIIRVYTSDSLNMYQLPYVYTNYVEDGDSGKALYTENRFMYFTWKTGDIFWLYYYFMDTTRPGEARGISMFTRKLRVDSMLKRQWNEYNNPYTMCMKSGPHLIKREKRNDELFELFTVKNVYDTSHLDSLQLFFKKSLSDVNVSLSKEFDSINQSKLFKAVLVFNPHYFDSFKTTSDSISLKWLLQKSQIEDSAKIRKMLDTFNLDRPRYQLK